jgi:hypothetical protein
MKPSDLDPKTLNRIRDFCVEEVKRQKRGAEQVEWMIEAWCYALDASFQDITLIQMLGHLVERESNTKNTWRNVPVKVGKDTPPHPSEIADRMERWVSCVFDMTPLEAYIEFEKIHPFKDGNGRVGKIIFNFLVGTMDYPIFPPNVFDEDFTT